MTPLDERTDERLSAYLDGALPPDEMEAVRGELAGSPELRARVAQLASVDDALRALEAPVADDALRERIRARLAEAPAADEGSLPGRAAPPRRRRAFGWSARLAVAASALAVAWLLISPPPGSSTDVAIDDFVPEDFLVYDAVPESDAEVIEVLDLLAGLDDLEETSG